MVRPVAKGAVDLIGLVAAEDRSLRPRIAQHEREDGGDGVPSRLGHEGAAVGRSDGQGLEGRIGRQPCLHRAGEGAEEG